MRLQEFIGNICDAGWSATSDAQWTKITALHKKLFPAIAQLEAEFEDANNEILNAREMIE